MTMKVVNVANGDYKLTVRDGGDIWLDVGDQSFNGRVIITGDLWVQGNTTTVSSETLTVKDNIIQLNEGGGSSTGISPTLDGRSGLLITRGGSADYADVNFWFDENVSHLDSTGTEKDGTFSFRRNTGGAGVLVGIQTCSINTEGQNLYLINAPGNGVVSVTGTTTYERNVFDYTQFELDPPEGPIEIIDPDALPNVQALKDYVDSSLAFFDDYAISEDDTGVECFNATPGPYNYYRTLLDPTYVGPANSKIVFTIDGSERGQFNPNGLDVDNVNIFTNTIDNGSANLILTSTAVNNTVEIDAVLQLDDTGLSPTAVAGSTKLYTVDSNTTPAPGKTGIYFTNQGNSDELVAKNRALLFSILF